MILIRSPEDLIENSNTPDGEARAPSPNTAALLTPPGNMAPAHVSGTRDGQPRLIDLNNLGLQKGAHLHTQYDSGQQGGTVGQGKYHCFPTIDQNGWPHGIPRNARIAALQAESSAPPQAEVWRHEQRHRVEKAVSRIQKTYVSEARASNLPPKPPDPDPPGKYRPATARPRDPVSLDTPQGWEQDKAIRARRAADRIKQTYVSEARASNLPPKPPDPDTSSQYRHVAGVPTASVPPQAEIWKHEQRQRVEDAVSRVHQTYVSEARVPNLSPEHLGKYQHPDRAPVTPPQAEIWKHDQCQKVENAVNRIQHTYISEVRFPCLPTEPPGQYHPTAVIPQLPSEPPDPDPLGQHRHPGGTPAVTTRPREPVSLHTPQGWEQDKATRTRRATDRIQQEYVDELRQDAHYMEQLRRRSTIHEALDEEKRQRERQRVRQELFRPVPRTDDRQTRVKVQPDSSDVHSRAPPGPSDTPSFTKPDLCSIPSLAPPGHCDTPSMAPPGICDVPSLDLSGLCDTPANMHAQIPLTEAELDEKRRQLLVQKAKSNKEQKEGKSKKKGKGGKRRSKTKSTENDASDAGSQNIPQPQEHDTSNKNVPRPPRRDAGDEFVPHPPKQDTEDERVPHPPRNAAGSQRIPHQPVAPVKDKEQYNNSYSTRKRRLVAKDQSSDGGGYAPSIAGMHGHGPSHRYYGPGSRDARAPGADVGNSASQPRLIPRQTSQQTMCWNSETAKRGLGFKSKQTREAEEEAKSKNAEAGKLSAEARNKWKKATFC